MRVTGFTLFAVLLLVFALPASAQQLAREDPIDTRLRAIAQTLSCPVCQGESLYDSHSGIAREMREIIREQLSDGRSEEEIRAFFLERYGEFVLMEPRRAGMNWLIWLGPFALLGLGSVFLALRLRALGRRGQGGPELEGPGAEGAP